MGQYLKSFEIIINKDGTFEFTQQSSKVVYQNSKYTVTEKVEEILVVYNPFIENLLVDTNKNGTIRSFKVSTILMESVDAYNYICSKISNYIARDDWFSKFDIQELRDKIYLRDFC